MGVLLKIGRLQYEFCTSHGRQFVTQDGMAEEFGCVRNDAKQTITVSDSLPTDEQLALAAQEAVIVLAEQAPCSLKWLDDAGIKYAKDRVAAPGVALALANGDGKPQPQPSGIKH